MSNESVMSFENSTRGVKVLGQSSIDCDEVDSRYFCTCLKVFLFCVKKVREETERCGYSKLDYVGSWL